MPAGTERGALIFCCSCGSGNVDVNSWKTDSVAVFRCSACGNQTEVAGFTIGRADDVPAGAVRDARGDIAWPRAFLARKPREA